MLNDIKYSPKPQHSVRRVVKIKVTMMRGCASAVLTLLQREDSKEDSHQPEAALLCTARLGDLLLICFISESFNSLSSHQPIFDISPYFPSDRISGPRLIHCLLHFSFAWVHASVHKHDLGAVCSWLLTTVKPKSMRALPSRHCIVCPSTS